MKFLVHVHSGVKKPEQKRILKLSKDLECTGIHGTDKGAQFEFAQRDQAQLFRTRVGNMADDVQEQS